ncbi:MAG: 3'-5' exonuclease, partial [Candidatus Kariarchaeaceae archaeon]
MKKKEIDDNQQTLDDFWGEPTTNNKEEEKKEKKESKNQEEVEIANNNERIIDNKSEEKTEEIQEDKEFSTGGKRKRRVGIEIDNDMEVRNVYLLDVEYDGPYRKAVCKFYDPVTHDLYLWYDNTNHLPYLLTTLSEDEIRGMPQVVSSEEFVSLEKEKRMDLMNDREIDVVKVVTTNPLAIGGRNDSFREIIFPSYETNIRYHYNYIFDKELVPGGLYSIINGKLIEEGTEIPEDARQSLEKAFEGASKEELEMLERYFPQFLSPIPDILRCAFDIEVYSPDSRLPAPQLAQQEIISIVVHDSLGDRTAYLLKRDEEPEIDLEALKITEGQLKIYENEGELLKDFFEEIKTYPIILSFNGDNFDLPYLLNRAKKLGIKENCPIKPSGKRDMAFTNGSIHIDLHRFYRQAAIRVYAFSGAYETVGLNDLGVALLNEGKVELEESISDLSAQNLLKYNLKDTEITLNLTTFANNVAFNLIITLMRITKMPMFDFTRTTVSTWIENWFRYEHRIRNYLIPKKEEILEKKGQISTMAANEGAKFQGAIVIDPTPGVHWNVYALDFACYSEDTEILTDEGWHSLIELKEKKEINNLPKIATVNPSSNFTEFQECQEIFEYDYDGEMYHFSKKTFDVLVTPNHRMVYNRRTNNREKTEWRDELEITDASELSKRTWFRIPHYGEWKGVSENIKIGPYTFSPEEFIPFLGWFLTDGSLASSGRTVIIHQSKVNNFESIRSAIYNLGFEVKENEYTKQDSAHRNFNIHNTEFVKGLRGWLIDEEGLYENNGKLTKRIPRKILNFEKEHLKLLFDAMLLGNGSWAHGKCYSLSSTSKKMADDFQELTLKLGYGCSVNKEVRDCTIFGKEYKNHVSYRCFISYTRKNAFNGQGNHIKKVDYNGKVWCVSVPNGTLIVRRNGKVAVSGNSLYPSIIKTRNLSYETLRCPHEECKVNKVPETDHWVCHKKQGISALLLGFVRDIRVNWFKPGAKDEKLTDLERNTNDVIQSSLKVLINAGYGVFGA